MWGAFGGQGLGRFDDIDALTCFADYRLPQLLASLGILVYSAELAAAVHALQPLLAGSAAEVQLRAATVQAVEVMRAAAAQAVGSLVTGARDSTNETVDCEPLSAVSAFQLDWILWERGEALLASLPPHHRTLMIFY